MSNEVIDFEEDMTDEQGGLEVSDIEEESGERDPHLSENTLDEEEEGHPEEEDVEEPFSDEPVVKKRNHDSIKARLNNAYRAKYQAEEAANRLAAENEYLRAAKELADQASMKHYEDSINSKIQQAKDLKIRALESGDLNGVAEADFQLSVALQHKGNAENYKAQQEIYNRGYSNVQQPYAPPQNYNQAETEMWLYENQWYDRSSPNYDAELAHAADKYGSDLNTLLERDGRTSEIRSKEYYDVIDQFVKNWRHQNDGHNQPNRSLNMRPSRSPVMAVSRSSANGSKSNNAENYKLSNKDKAMHRGIAAALGKRGMSEKQYAKFVIADRKNHPHNGR